ncbi:MAG: Na-translocating system protein MpsC family protein [Firmicutes bacterium]|nr:Na-translocating system protein MpsC family protein [Bacillota bacterium]MDD4708300.1 Na-translocating system protein MpsC family protein [Bacillota bacterium]
MAAQIKREFTGRYKEAFGKGPENTAVEIIGDVIIIKLQGFLTPMEQAMHKLPDGAKKVEGIRDVIYRSFVSELGELLKRLTDKNITRVLKNLNLDDDKEHIFIIMEGVIEKVG